jgi:hypothetical protein
MTATNDNKGNYLYIQRQNMPINLRPGGSSWKYSSILSIESAMKNAK